MRLAAALDVPVIALLQMKRSSFYAPRGPRDRALVNATIEEAVAAVRESGVSPSEALG
jgi:ADP-heptose:LPS heptosyltransferase